MFERWKTFWRQVNEPPINPEKYERVTNAAMNRIVTQYYLRPHWGGLVVLVILSCLTGGAFKYFLAWTGRYIADDIVQVHLLAADVPEAATSNLIQPGESRTFALNAEHNRQSWTKRIENRPGISRSEQLRRAGILALLLGLAVGGNLLACELIGRYRTQIGQKTKFRLRCRVYEKLHSLPMSFHSSNAVGSFMTNLFSDVAEIPHFVLTLAQHIPIYLMTTVMGLWILFSIDPSLALWVLLALPAYGFSYTWFHGRHKVVNENLRERQGRLNAHITNRIRNFYLVKSFVREISESIDFLRRSRPIIRDTMNSAVLGSLFSVVCTILSGVCMVVVLWLGALRVRDGQMSLGDLLLFYSSAGFLFGPVASISSVVAWFHRLRTLCHKVVRVLDEPVCLDDPDQAVPVPTEAPELRFENVSLRYSRDRQPALQELSFTLPAGKTLCVMGPSGAGKSSLAKLACRIYDPTEGAVSVGGHDIRQFKLAHLRRIAGYVNQEPIIFDGTIQDNIRYGSESRSFRNVVAAAQYAQIHDFITRLPEQYDTLTCERGLTLSGGQKQRVNLARVLLYDPKLLVLDDCTSALDAETEAKLIEGFGQVLQGRTVMLVSHRISIALRCDYVMMLDEGRVTEWGRPEDLLEQDGPFAELYHEQVSRGHNVLQYQEATA